MSYIIRGIDPQPFAGLNRLTDEELVRVNARRVVADKKPGFPCRVSLEDAEPGESLILTNYVSQEAPTPYCTAYAIYVREGRSEQATYVDELPPVFRGRVLSLRGFDEEGMLRGALLSEADEHERKIFELLDRPEIATIHAHNAAPGCFAAKIGRN